eukprot:gene28732-34967_t
MPRGTYLTEKEQGQILAYKDENLSMRKIGRRLKRSDKVVRNFLRDSKKYGSLKSGGPKEKLTQRAKRLVIKTASNTMKSLRQIKSELQLDVSTATVQRVLHASPHIQRQKLISCPRLLPGHKI